MTRSTFLDAVPYIDIKYEDWLNAGELSNKLRKKGAVLSLTDIAIAAVAIKHDMAVATLDKHFNLIPGLRLYGPASG